MHTEELRLSRCGFCQRDLRYEKFEIFKRSWHADIRHEFCQECRIKLDSKARTHALYTDRLVDWARFRMRGVLGGAKPRDLVVGIDDLDLIVLFLDQGGVCALTGLPFSLRRKPVKSRSEGFPDTPGLTGFKYLKGAAVPVDGYYRDKRVMAPSVDRIDSRKGYTASNIHLVLQVVNTMKSDMPLDDFVALCRSVATSQRSREAEITRAIGWV